MKAIILAGGRGTRLRPITYEIPKPLIPVRKKPIISHLIDFLTGSKVVTEIAILASIDHKEDFEEWYKEWNSEFAGIKISIFYEKEPLGTFGGFVLIRDWIGENSFIVSNGDELKKFELEKMISFHNSHNGVGTIALVKVPNPHEYGVPVLKGNLITEFLEKPNDPPGNYISSGLYMFDTSVFDYADFSRGFLMTEHDISPNLAKDGKLYGIKLEGKWYDCGTMERYEKAIKEW
jgi:NDP-sugar pyrophosphorylase family protein